MSPNNPLRALAGALLLCAAAVATALPEDRQQAIHITSDNAVQENSTVTYRGHVVIVQGSMRIEANQVVVHYIQGKLERVVATGTPVRFQQQPEANAGLITGSAQTLIYHHSDQRVELLQNALVDRDQSSVKGSRIEYVIPSKTVRAEGAGSQQGQVEMVLQPGEDAAAPPPAPAAAPANPATPAAPDPTPAPAPAPAPAGSR